MKRLTIHEIKEDIIANYFDGDESDSLVAALEGKLREAEAAKIRAELEAKMAKEDAERMQKEIKTSAPDVAEFKVLLLIAAEVVAVLVLIAWLLGR